MEHVGELNAGYVLAVPVLRLVSCFYIYAPLDGEPRWNFNDGGIGLIQLYLISMLMLTGEDSN